MYVCEFMRACVSVREKDGPDEKKRQEKSEKAKGNKQNKNKETKAQTSWRQIKATTPRTRKAEHEIFTFSNQFQRVQTINLNETNKQQR